MWSGSFWIEALLSGCSQPSCSGGVAWSAVEWHGGSAGLGSSHAWSRHHTPHATCIATKTMRAVRCFIDLNTNSIIHGPPKCVGAGFMPARAEYFVQPERSEKG